MRERVRPRAAAASSIAAAGVEREIRLGWPAHIAHERYNREHGALRQRRRHFGIGAQCLSRARLGQFLAVGEASSAQLSFGVQFSYDRCQVRGRATSFPRLRTEQR